MPFNWVCPFCDRAQTVTDEQVDIQSVGLVITRHRYGNLGAKIMAIGCTNTDCADVTVNLELCTMVYPAVYINNQRHNFDNYAGKTFENYNLRPESTSRVQPDFIPEALREDYYEACLIKNKSSKSAATLARRCLQGMIRNFCNISKATLNQEIETLRKAIEEGKAPRGVTEESVEAIDAVRSIGNIGAHMERDINIIIDVDPGESQSLIDLIELIFEEWYVAQNNRQLKLAKVAAIAAEKKAEITEAKLKALPPPT